jgi:RNA polymerase-binding transcription factor DksA
MTDEKQALPPLPAFLQDTAKLNGFRAALVKKMGDVNAELERLLSNQKGTLGTMKIPGLGGASDQEDPIDRLRKYLELLKKQVAHINKKDGLYGRCEHCGAPLSEPELSELPWADACRGCAAKG